MMDGDEFAKAEQDDEHLRTTTIQQDQHQERPQPAADAIGIRGGGCIPSALCNEQEVGDGVADIPATEQHKQIEERAEEQPTAWKGWAEIENDPEIFTILVQEWGVPDIHVEEVLDITELPNQNPNDILGLIFLSRYVPPDTSQSSTPITKQDCSMTLPWFANQISRFSCGTVALMNILMNSEDFLLSETLSSFKNETRDFDAKSCGVALDEHEKFRDIHNSFSTLLDRLIVDQLLKEDMQAAARRSQTPKRKKGRKGRKRQTTSVDEGEAGNHFIAYVSVGGKVWRLDGMESRPQYMEDVAAGTTWLDVASAALMQQIEDAIQANYDVSLMKVTKINVTPLQGETARLERERKQEDWAPFIEHMLRLHAEKGDLAQKLGL